MGGESQAPPAPGVPGAVVTDILDRMEDPLLAPERAVSLPIECYTSADWFEFERRAVWDREWICLGHHGTIPQPGDYFRVEVNDDPLLVSRGRDGTIGVVSAVCQHRGHLLGEARGNARQFVCPYHGWAYGLDGTLLGAPATAPYATLAELRETHCLPRLRTEIWNGFIFVNLDGRARPLAPRLKAFTAALANHRLADLHALPTDDIPDNPWNWKWMQENGLEPYHTPVAHRGTHDVAPAHQSDFPDWNEDDDAAVYYTTRFIHVDGNFTRSQKCLFPILPTLTLEDRWRVLFGVVPPNLLISTLPDCAFYFLILPHGAGAMTLRVGFLFPEATVQRPDFPQKYAEFVADINAINNEDIAANISVQKGRRSRFARQGRVMPLETPLVQFNHWLVRRYREYAAELGWRPRSGPAR